MSIVIERFAHHVSPVGPLGDYDARMREEQEWQESLTVADALELITWAGRPGQLPGRPEMSDAELQELVGRALMYAGRAGRRLDDARIRTALEDLLDAPETRTPSIDGLSALGDPRSVAALSKYAINAGPATAYHIAMALEEIGGEDSRELLRRMAARWQDNRRVMDAVEVSLRELG
jgi:hypothetical protein